MAAASTYVSEATGQGDDSLQTVAPKAPITYQHVVTTSSNGIPSPNVPRALEAVDGDHPKGTPGYDNKGYSVLQQHILFFDRNNDGVIYPWETFEGFHALGFNVIISFLAMCFVNISFSFATLDSWIPSLMFPIYIKNIHRAKHGSDSEVYDTEGRFVPQKFEEIFSKFAKTDKSGVTYNELYTMTNAIRNAYDPFGWTAAKLEWGITYWLLKDKNGFVSKEVIRGMYDGSIFDYISKEVEAKRGSKSKKTL